MRIAIVGLGPWGLCTLERIIAHARRHLARSVPLEVHVIDPGPPGVGIYDLQGPDYLVMNNVCGDITLSESGSAVGPRGPHERGLYEWAAARGYGWRDGACAIDPAARPVAADDFLPRRIMGEYLHWYYQAVVGHLPAGMSVVHHAMQALDISALPDGGESITLADGGSLRVDHAILTFGHVENEAPADANGPRLLAPYAAGADMVAVGPRDTVAVCGMGLVATDVVMMLTLGRGGVFEESHGRLRYRPSGREPGIRLVSRSGLPYRAKSTQVSQVSGRAEAFVFHDEAIEALRRRGPASINFAEDVLPLLYREMSVRHQLQALHETEGPVYAQRWAQRLRRLRSLADVDDALQTLSTRCGPFDAAAVFHGVPVPSTTAAACQAQFCRTLLDEVMPSPRSGPLNAACETFRVLRDGLREVVEDGRLTLESYHSFHGRLRNDINRLVAGPPAWRLRQLLALVDAGVLRVPFGAAPRIHRLQAGAGRWRIESTHLETPHAEDVDLLVRGHLEDPRLDTSSSPLLTALYRRGRLAPWRYGGTAVGSVDMTPDEHPVDRDGRVQHRLWLFGALTEGARFFTHYVPSPTRGARAYRDIDRCINAILE